MTPFGECGETVEELADSLIREAEAIHQMEVSSVWVVRGEPDEAGEWLEVTPDVRRCR